MPPSRNTSQCIVVDTDNGGRRCRRNGTGYPSLCQRHRELLTVPTPVSPVLEILSSWLRGDTAPRRAYEDAFIRLAEQAIQRPLTAEEKHALRTGKILDLSGFAAAAAGSSSSPPPSSGPRKPPPDPGHRAREQEARTRAALISRARRTLGFSAKEELTHEKVKARHRELARKHHPDRNPDKADSLRKMQDINAAVEILLKPA